MMKVWEYFFAGVTNCHVFHGWISGKKQSICLIAFHVSGFYFALFFIFLALFIDISVSPYD